jgi:hypothetical protein
LNLLDSGVRRNDEFLGFLTFYEYIKNNSTAYFIGARCALESNEKWFNA